MTAPDALASARQTVDAPTLGATPHSALYRGEVMHARHDERAKRAFRYGVYMAMLDLDEVSMLGRSLRLFSHRRRNLFSFDERDYNATLAPSVRARSTLTQGLAALRAGNGISAPRTTRLLTNLRVAGYVFNPVSFFIDYDARGDIASVIAEVNNTYGGAFRYVLGSQHRLPPDRHGRVGFRHVRELFVSPFLHGELTYEFWFDAPLDGEVIEVEMFVTRGEQRVFTARFGGKRTTMTDRNLAAAALRYPLMTAQVIGLIHLEAWKLRLSGVPYRRPEANHRPLADEDTVRSG